MESYQKTQRIRVRVNFKEDSIIDEKDEKQIEENTQNKFINFAFPFDPTKSINKYIDIYLLHH